MADSLATESAEAEGADRWGVVTSESSEDDDDNNEVGSRSDEDDEERHLVGDGRPLPRAAGLGSGWDTRTWRDGEGG